MNQHKKNWWQSLIQMIDDVYCINLMKNHRTNERIKCFFCAVGLIGWRENHKSLIFNDFGSTVVILGSWNRLKSLLFFIPLRAASNKQLYFIIQTSLNKMRFPKRIEQRLHLQHRTSKRNVWMNLPDWKVRLKLANTEILIDWNPRCTF